MVNSDGTRGCLALFLILCPPRLWESTPPRLWRASRAEIATACKVSKMAVSKWCRALAVPGDAARKVLAEQFHIQESWWHEAVPDGFFGSPEMLVMCWMLGIAKPDMDQRLVMASTMGIPVEDWDLPAAVAC